jgi:hypothetical protein
MTYVVFERCLPVTLNFEEFSIILIATNGMHSACMQTGIHRLQHSFDKDKYVSFKFHLSLSVKMCLQCQATTLMHVISICLHANFQ